MTKQISGYRHAGGNVYVATATDIRRASGLPAANPAQASSGRSTMLASMRRTLTAMGLTPVEDPGAGLPPAEASMRRELARMRL